MKQVTLFSRERNKKLFHASQMKSESTSRQTQLIFRIATLWLRSMPPQTSLPEKSPWKSMHAVFWHKKVLISLSTVIHPVISTIQNLRHAVKTVLSVPFTIKKLHFMK